MKRIIKSQKNQPFLKPEIFFLFFFFLIDCQQYVVWIRIKCLPNWKL